MAASPEELRINRYLTKQFIDMDPTSIVLLRRARVDNGAGGWRYSSALPRPAQVFKLIPQGGPVNGLTETTDGAERKYDFVLLGEHDADVDVGDYWLDADGSHWVVEGFIPSNEYEIRAGVRAVGEKIADG